MYTYVLFLVVLAFILEYVSMHVIPDSLQYSSKPSKHTLEPDEEFTLDTVLINESFLPALSVKVTERVPVELECLDNRVQFARESTYASINSSVYLMPHQKLTRHTTVRLPGRGRYLFRGGDVTGGDFLGLQETEINFSQLEEVVVLPPRIESPDMVQTLGGLMGDISVQRFILEDPVLTLGFRDYTGREPMKSINWKQSARNNRLVVSKYDYTQDFSVTIVLNVDHSYLNTRNTELLEKTFSYTRMLIEGLEEKQVKYRFITNATTAGSLGSWYKLEEGLGSRHMNTILEGIGRASYDSRESFESLMTKVIASAEQGQTHIILTPQRENRCAKEVYRLRDLTGCACAFLYAEEGGRLEWN